MSTYQKNQPHSAQLREAMRLRQRPSGWPVGSFDSYADAQRAIDTLSDREFPVSALTIVGVDLMEVESVMGRLTWPRVLGSGALSGAWLGLFVGLLLGIFAGPLWAPVISSVLIGIIFGVVFAAIPYALSSGQRDFTSATAIVAGRYDILCEPQHARQARDVIAEIYPTRGGGVVDPRREDSARPASVPAEPEGAGARPSETPNDA